MHSAVLIACRTRPSTPALAKVMQMSWQRVKPRSIGVPAVNDKRSALKYTSIPFQLVLCLFPSCCRAKALLSGTWPAAPPK